MNQLIGQDAEQGDVFQLSRDNLVVVLFAKTQSPYFNLAVGVGKGASTYHETKTEKSSLHTCVFGRSPEQAARAITLLRYVETWTTTQMFVAGRLVTGSTIDVYETLKCYQQACCCTDPDAHCLLVSDNIFKQDRNASEPFVISIALLGEETPAKPKQKRYVMPCQRVCRYEHIERDHPSKWQDQIQAMAVHHEIDWCPLFDLSKFRQYD